MKNVFLAHGVNERNAGSIFTSEYEYSSSCKAFCQVLWPRTNKTKFMLSKNTLRPFRKMNGIFLESSTYSDYYRVVYVRYQISSAYMTHYYALK